MHILRRLAATILSILLVFLSAAPALARGTDSLPDEVASGINYLQTGDPGGLSLLAAALWGQPAHKDAASSLHLELRQSRDSISDLSVLWLGILNLTALGEDPQDFEGMDLLQMLCNSPLLYQQDLEGTIYSLLALQCAPFPDPDGLIRQRVSELTEHLLALQSVDGGFYPAPGAQPDPLITALAITALIPATEGSPEAAAAVDRAAGWLIDSQNGNATFSDTGIQTSEATSAALIALCGAGYSPEDTGLVKEGRTIPQALLLFQNPDGGFAHTVNAGSNPGDTALALIALAAVDAGQPVFDLSPLYLTGQPQSTLQIYGSFAAICVGVVVIIYACLLVTQQIGRWHDKKHGITAPSQMTDGSPASEQDPPSQSQDPQ